MVCLRVGLIRYFEAKMSRIWGINEQLHPYLVVRIFTWMHDQLIDTVKRTADQEQGRKCEEGESFHASCGTMNMPTLSWYMSFC